MLKAWWRKAVGALIVCDSTKMKTLDDVKYWKDKLDENAVLPDNLPIPWVLVANKSDLLTDKLSNEKVDKESLDMAWYNHR